MTKKYASYVQGHLLRAKEAEARKAGLFRQLGQRVKDTALTLGHKYELQRVYLFGSLTDPSRFHQNSDIDLAVVGLEPSRFLEIWGDLEILLNHPFDLVQFERTTPALQKCILEEGVIVYDREHEKS